ncbi:tRNA pseudouridine synthase D TruD [mine drainage metagenome]|uniref:tRNA pseudouridine synthase D TruD n=1 Tax=mine drainage metagenome TaxID=410659 RepID=T1ARP7_9ZZZZ
MVEPVEGTIKNSAEDFVVEEIAKNGRVMEIDRQYTPDDLGMQSSPGKFSVFVLQKKDWNTVQALKMVARKASRGIKSVGFAGTKDRTSISTQLCSIFGAEPDRLLSMHMKDMSINSAWKSDVGIKMGDLLGNRFTININMLGDADEAMRRLDAISMELGERFPNYFGGQRFGNRGNNVDIGVAMLKGDFEAAAMSFLASPGGETMMEAVEARKRLAEERDFGEALSYFPKYLKYELTVIDYLSKYPGNYANALRKLPRQLFLMFIHSVESYIFNAELADRIKSGMVEPGRGALMCKAGVLGFPDLSNTFRAEEGNNEGFELGNLIGYEIEDLTDFENSMLESMGLKKEDFKVKGIPELNSKGGRRAYFAPFGGFMYSAASEGTIRMGFSLPSGAYATALLNEFVRSEVQA